MDRLGDCGLELVNPFLSIAEEDPSRLPPGAVNLNAQRFEGTSKWEVLVPFRHQPPKQTEKLRSYNFHGGRLILSAAGYKVIKEATPWELQGDTTEPPQRVGYLRNEYTDLLAPKGSARME